MVISFRQAAYPEFSSFLTDWKMVTTGTIVLDQKQKHNWDDKANTPTNVPGWPSGEKILPLCPHHLPDWPAQERSELLSHLYHYIMRSFCYRRQDSPNQYGEVATIDLQRKCRASWVENMWGKIFISVWKSYCLCYVMLKQLVKILPIVSGNSNDIAPKMTMF